MWGELPAPSHPKPRARQGTRPFGGSYLPLTPEAEGEDAGKKPLWGRLPPPHTQSRWRGRRGKEALLWGELLPLTHEAEGEEGQGATFSFFAILGLRDELAHKAS